jgi:enoyl-CoA hydratase
MPSKTYEKILYRHEDGGIAVVTLNSPATSNAQDVQMLRELDDAMMDAARDASIKVIILAGEGKHFSAGHDLRAGDFGRVGKDAPLTSVWDNPGTQTMESWLAWEHEMYLDYCKRWRGIAKPTIAQVQGACIAGALMLAWTCDLIVASDDALFQDPVVNLGVGGVEYFAHAWEIGSRRAKEKLFTADSWSAQDALDWGMVNRVVPRAELAAETMALARKIASKPSFGLKMAKAAVNGCADAAGFTSAMDHAFALHHLCHAQNRLIYGTLIDPAGVAPAILRSLPGGKLPKIETYTAES